MMDEIQSTNLTDLIASLDMNENVEVNTNYSRYLYYLPIIIIIRPTVIQKHGQ